MPSFRRLHSQSFPDHRKLDVGRLPFHICTIVMCGSCFPYNETGSALLLVHSRRDVEARLANSVQIAHPSMCRPANPEARRASSNRRLRERVLLLALGDGVASYRFCFCALFAAVLYQGFQQKNRAMSKKVPLEQSLGSKTAKVQRLRVYGDTSCYQWHMHLVTVAYFRTRKPHRSGARGLIADSTSSSSTNPNGGGGCPDQVKITKTRSRTFRSLAITCGLQPLKQTLQYSSLANMYSIRCPVQTTQPLET